MYIINNLFTYRRIYILKLNIEISMNVKGKTTLKIKAVTSKKLGSKVFSSNGRNILNFSKKNSNSLYKGYI